MTGFDSIIFDLDGTLIDGSADIAAALNAALDSHGHGRVTVEQVAAALGGGPRKLVEKCLAASRTTVSGNTFEKILTAYSTNYLARPADRTVLLDTAGTVLTSLQERGVRLGVCTNKRTAIAESVLETLGVRNCFDAVIGSDTVAAPKPHPAHLLETIAAMGIGGSRVLYVGDTAIDEATATGAGIPYAHMSWGESDVSADFVLTSFNDLFPITTPER
ncbi:HAD hydrolase-like protein [Rhodococcus sp. BP-349]|uniref:HAD family hydrolase n=1 Tax=unclassified Rhodococcus (in: high G+C Gram-positive bacteria) TaxID=192944 RepID=UPI001C9AA515|nr:MULTISPECIES: HAD hydrolase-like protein [unclassified Rhodococcus (in: high G+C Gram-positive bacteria)]MBY6537280.1 HAD hydrolase-like protein [Rhodococcus sp. BP-363]MBY6541617.1 HAD hydrolase-like protein [Rhodococcus sp. BP-369]MBY6560847.1 HAD hydrolase-like protein [Rhodococcus sp. BP-370]MBY6575139.1 HAD hydrolase-like protein [Rhodococcus sp. BP-364]MBY6584440.1 HAD hydrolase-like protein [Rhodococcus sp. BP-358]